MGTVERPVAILRCDAFYPNWERLYADLIDAAGPPLLTYRTYDATRELPSDADMAGALAGVVITGSASDAHEDHKPWILALRGWLQRHYGESRALSTPPVPLLGICFGHQVVAHALGGRAARAAGGLVFGARLVALDPSSCMRLVYFRRAAEATGGALPPLVRLMESHNDEVAELPPGAVLLARSFGTPVEMFAIGGHVLCMQGHPEFATGHMNDVIVPLRYPACGPGTGVSEEELATLQRSMAQVPPGPAFPEACPVCPALLRTFPEGGPRPAKGGTLPPDHCHGPSHAFLSRLLREFFRGAQI